MPVLFSLLTFFPLQLFLQSLKILLSGQFPKDKNDADFSQNALQRQETVKPKDIATTCCKHAHVLYNKLAL